MNDKKNKSECNQSDGHQVFLHLDDVDDNFPRSDNENFSDIENSIRSQNDNKNYPDFANDFAENDDPFDNPNVDVINSNIWDSDDFKSIFSMIDQLKKKTQQIENNQNNEMNIQINDDVKKLKNDFYGIFTWKKKFQKNWLLKCTNSF